METAMENNRDEKQSLESPSAVKLKEFSKIALLTAAEIACFFAGGVIAQKITEESVQLEGNSARIIGR